MQINLVIQNDVVRVGCVGVYSGWPDGEGGNDRFWAGPRLDSQRSESVLGKTK